MTAFGAAVNWLEQLLAEQDDPGSIPVLSLFPGQKMVGKYFVPADVKLFVVGALGYKMSSCGCFLCLRLTNTVMLL